MAIPSQPLFCKKENRQVPFRTCRLMSCPQSIDAGQDRGPARRGGAFAPYKRFGPAAQNLGAGRIHFARAFRIPQVSKKKHQPVGWCFFLEAPPRIELGNKAFAELCLTAWLWRHMDNKSGCALVIIFGAGDEARTRYLHLGKVALYQMSYTCISLQEAWSGWCLRPESNQRHGDFQSPALPTELQRHMATRKGLEPSTSGVTGRRSNQLNYRAI